MNSEIAKIEQQIKNFTISSSDELETFRLKFLSKKGSIQELFKFMRKIPKQDKAAFGKSLNELKNLAQDTFDQAKITQTDTHTVFVSATDDISLTSLPLPVGSVHPLTKTLQEIKNIFYRLGFNIADGPEVEDDFHNFTALNFPPNHPARDTQDTFFIRKDEDPTIPDLVLRTHTSPVQIRLMKKQAPPIRSIIPGRVYRNEAVSPKSYFLFHQVEALYVDRYVSVADLKESLITFVKLMYGSDVIYRLRPSYFPFTEPSLEMDIWWGSKPNGKWLEILGSGMVDPNVFMAAGVDPEQYSGFAWGMGVERIAILKYGISDIRTFFDNDIRFLHQFI
ncbi:MAG: phenylalanine--tRNA ligase subunit alpha [Balneola sp.]|nr:phenylalanine--tRNA ligase subunit alpha [Balneola sp.]|tara:strand:- start:15669 stop:16676 length:1008 start_codon:yes stop_codon:yes gene_type:complete